MIENELKKVKRLSVSSREQLTTKIGEVVKFKVVFKGNQRTVYSPAGLSYFELEEYIDKIEYTKQISLDPNAIKNEGTTPKKFIKKKSLQYIKDVKSNIHRDEIERSDLFVLIKQTAMEQSFEDVKSSKISARTSNR